MKIPKELQLMMKNADTKKAFIYEVPKTNPNACENCGGAGTVHVFIAVAGPFQSPPGLGKVGHYDNGWWQGNMFSSTCPDCNGVGHLLEEINAVPNPAATKQMEMLEERFDNARKPYKDD